MAFSPKTFLKCSHLCNEEGDAGKVHEEDGSCSPLVVLGPVPVVDDINKLGFSRQDMWCWWYEGFLSFNDRSAIMLTQQKDRPWWYPRPSPEQIMTERVLARYIIYSHIYITGPNLDDHNEVNDDADNAASITSLHLPSIILIYLASNSTRYGK